MYVFLSPLSQKSPCYNPLVPEGIPSTNSSEAPIRLSQKRSFLLFSFYQKLLQHIITFLTNRP